MKKHLLFTALLASSSSFAQSLDLSNEPSIAEYQLMYVCDTLTDAYSSTTGNGVTWDYSEIAGLNNETSSIEVIDPATTDSAAHFSTSTKAFRIQNSLTNYFNSSATERVSQGFVYEEPNFGVVMATFETDEQITMQYPFSNGDYFSDNFAGSLEFTFNGVPQNPNHTGSSYAAIDGQGTLLLPNATTVSNVIRYKIIDTVFTQVIFVIPLDVEFIRTQYEYYDVANNNLPIFIHTSVIIQQQGATTPLLEQTIVLSSVEPDFAVGLNETMENQFTVYPNPTIGTINFKGDFGMEASASILDNSGRLVHEIHSLTNGQSADLSALNKGMYLVVINDNGTQTTSTIVLR